MLVENERLSFTMEQNGLARCVIWCIFTIRVLETSKLKPQPRKSCYNVLNSQLNTPPHFATSHPFIYRNDQADLRYSSIQPAHDPQAIQHGAGRKMKGPPLSCLLDRNRFYDGIAQTTLQQKLGETYREGTRSYLQTPRMRSRSLLFFAGRVSAFVAPRQSESTQRTGRTQRSIDQYASREWMVDRRPLVLEAIRPGKQRGLLSSPFLPVLKKCIKVMNPVKITSG